MKFSVIVPVYEHWHLVPTLLQCLTAQTLPRDEFEILLVDNGSSKFTPPDTLPPNARVLECQTPGSYAARNAALREARGEWLAFTDADCRPTPTWLEQLQTAATNNTTLLAGAVDVVSDAEKPNAYEMYDMVKGIPQAWYVRRGYAATANLAVPRKIVEALGGFDEKRFSGGDADFCLRAKAHGHQIIFLPDALVRHPARNSWNAIATKARRLKDGQLRQGTIRTRLIWYLRTPLPPVRQIVTFLCRQYHPPKYRVTAALVQLRVWGLELGGLYRLFSRAQERH